MTYSIAFHSYKGGTGKTTIASNLSAFLAKKGYIVCLLDLDIYAPSLQTYFEITPKKWINDYLYGDAKFDDIITDIRFLSTNNILSSSILRLCSLNTLYFLVMIIYKKIQPIAYVF